MSTAIYSFSGDPITFGHINVIKRGLKMFDNIIVAIGSNPDKKYTFNLEERKFLAIEALKGLPVKVESFNGLLVDFAQANGINMILRSVRNVADYQYEEIMHNVNTSQKLGIETIVLFCDQNLSHISSSAVKELQKNHGCLEKYVPLIVKQELERKISNQFLLGITGGIGTGKSFIAQRFIECGQTINLPVHNIDFDTIGKDILTTLTDTMFIETRKRLIKEFGQICMANPEMKFIHVKVLSDIIFSSPTKLAKFNEIMFVPMLFQLRQLLFNKKGLILLNCALIAECNIGHLTNNNVILIGANDDTVCDRLTSRGYNNWQISNRVSSQNSYKEKFNKLALNTNDHGKLLVFDNSIKDPRVIDDFFNKVIVKEYNLSQL